MLRNYLKTARPSIGNGNVLLIVTDDTVAHGILSEAEYVQEIKETIERNIGSSTELEIYLRTSLGLPSLNNRNQKSPLLCDMIPLKQTR